MKLAPTIEAAFLYLAKENRLQDDNDKPKGLFVPHHLSFIVIVNQKEENTINQNKVILVEAYGVIGAFPNLNGDYDKAIGNS